MILKTKDSLAPQLGELERLLSSTTVPELRKRIAQEISIRRAGAKGEQEAAYHIDFGWKSGQNSVVLHDLRLKHEGRVAQIDHLILFRSLECHVLESIGFASEVRITETGEWETKARSGWMGIPSPVEQNRRHIEVLRAYIHDHHLTPRRLGIALPITFHNWVLVAPGCQIRREGPDLDHVVKMDQFETRFKERLDNAGVAWVVSRLPKMVSLETVLRVAHGLLAAHQPAKFNFAARFGLPPPLPVRAATPPGLSVEPCPKHCQNCGLSIDEKVVAFCRLNARKFSSRVVCQRCQQLTPARSCDDCGNKLEPNVVAFCRSNSRKFAGKTLCRGCQALAVKLRHAAVLPA